MTSMKSRITGIVLTYNEQKHLARCLESLLRVTDEIIVADCFSDDATLDIARAHGSRVIQRRWVNYATQFNWALEQVNPSTEWVLRLDADEYLTPELVEEIQSVLPHLGPEVDGVHCGRRMTFQGQMIRWGGVFPVRVLRLFRHGRGHCENRWMDEHIKVVGKVVDLHGEIIDDNLNTLTWWTAKHNAYASREAVDLLNLKYGFLATDSVAGLSRGQAGRKRWLKEKIYAHLPPGFRAFTYFFYRYVLRLGFLDGRVGGAFHVLQGFWYRYLVDLKVLEVERYLAQRQCSPQAAIEAVLAIKLD
jgi:glycosyltransferase involved in cell wall biosynthesis